MPLQHLRVSNDSGHEYDDWVNEESNHHKLHVSPCDFHSKYSGVLPDINPTIKTVIMMNITIYIRPTPLPPGIDWMNMPKKAESIVKG